MKFKLDENLGKNIRELFVQNGHDAESVFDENIQDIEDDKLFKVCRKEKRCLVTLDLDFSNVLRFPPEESSGIIIIRPGKEIKFDILKSMLQEFFEFLIKNMVGNELLIVEEGRIRIHKSE